MFDLNHAIARWRCSLEEGGIMRREVLDELESHLRDEIDNLVRSGVTEEEAVRVASRRLGGAHDLKEEFCKVRGESVRFWDLVNEELLPMNTRVTKTLRILLHSFILGFANLGSILVGFFIWFYVFRPSNQRLVQGLLAMIVCTISFLLWTLAVRYVPAKGLPLRGKRELIWTFLLTLVWGPAIGVPLHYVTQGYLTSFGNIVAMWVFQVPTNFLILLILGVTKLRYAGKPVIGTTQAQSDMAENTTECSA